MGFAKSFIGGSVIQSTLPPSLKASQWIDISSGSPEVKVFDSNSNEWVSVSGGSKTEIVNTITERDALTKSEGLSVFVSDATLDESVDLGWAIYSAVNDTWVKTAEQESLDIASGGVIDTISADKVIESSTRRFITASKEAMIESNASEIASHSIRLNAIEAAPAPISDGKVKLDSTDNSNGYLMEKVDGTTLQKVNGKLTVKGIDGLNSTLAELNQLVGITSNVQTQLNNISGVSSFRGVFTSIGDLQALTDSQAGDYAIVSGTESSDYYFYYGSSWDYSHGATGVSVIDINNSTTGILPKTRYEKQNATDTPFADTSGSLVATNTHDALIELFQYANNGKASIATAIGSPLTNSDTFSTMKTKIQQQKLALAQAITNKGIVAYAYNTFDEMATKIGTIPNVSIAGKVKSTSKLNITAPYTHQIVLNEALSIEDIATTVLQYAGNNSGVVHYNSEYNNGEASSFVYDADVVAFDGFMNIKDRWDYVLTTSGDNYYESVEIDFNKFTQFAEDLIIESNLSQVSINGLQEYSVVVKAKNDISINGVESLDSVTFKNFTGGNGLAKLAVTFDSGITWNAYNGTEWITVDVDNKEDFALNGMDKTMVNTLSNAELKIPRNNSNFIRFAYLLQRPLHVDVAKNDSIELKVTMLGYNEIAPNNAFDYGYNALTKTLTYSFKNSGTFTVNYVDG